MQILLPYEVRIILNKLQEGGYAAYAVGGCVRDSLLGRSPMDWDITTAAKPEVIKQVFEKTIDTGIAHGTITVRMNHQSFEVTTYRVDGEYEDNRHPKHVTFADSICDDLARRDFTVNAMAYNEANGLVDPFGGQKDLNDRVIRCVGEANLRFLEDALRILRAARFCAQLDFDVMPEVQQAMCRQAERLNSVSAERIREELTKTILAGHADKGIRPLFDSGVLDVILPELSRCFRTTQNIKYHLYDVGTHTMHVLMNTPQKTGLRYAALFHDLGKPAKKTIDPDGTTHFKGHAEVSVMLALEIMHRLKFDNKTIDCVRRLVQYHDREIVPEKKPVKRAVLDVGEDIFLDLLDLKRADALGQNLVYTRPRLALYDEIEQIYHRCREEQEAFCLRDLAVNGRDLTALGFQGKEIGALLNNLLEYVLERPEENKKENLLQILKKYQNLWLNGIK